MKKILFILSLSLLFLNTNAQERTTIQDTIILPKTKSLTRATGWEYHDSSNKWESSKNSVSKQNFKSLYFKKVRINDVDYYVLFHVYTKGAYRYPNLQMDWYTYEKTDFYCLSKEQYTQLFNNKGECDSLQIVDYSGEKVYVYKSKTDRMIVEDVEKVVNGYHSKDLTQYYILRFKKSDDGKYMRFLLPYFYYKSKYSSDRYDFKQCYFEVPLAEWEKLSTLE